jgi:hypothetical protein
MNRSFLLSLKTLVATVAFGLASAVHAGDPTGANFIQDRVTAMDTDAYEILFAGREDAAIYVVGDGDTDLDLFVYDENDNLVCSDEDETDAMLCEWTPRRTGTFRVEIVNLGGVYNEYSLVTN